MSSLRLISDPPSRCFASSEICWIASMMGSTTCGSASRLADTPATNDFVSRGTSVLVRSSRIELNPFNPSRPPFRPPSERVNATAPPLTETALSIPLGFPCKTFSARNAYPSMMSVSELENRSWDGFEMIPCANSKEEAAQVENAADEPRPAPMGKLAEAVNVAPGLPRVSLIILKWLQRQNQLTSSCHFR